MVWDKPLLPRSFQRWDASGLIWKGLENFIQTDVLINCGNSSGTLLNLNGELIGINTALLAPRGGSIGIGFTIPSNMAQQLIQFDEIKRRLLGIKGTEMTADISKASVKSGDLIISLNSNPLNSFAALRSRIATTELSTKVKLGLLRDGKPLEMEVTLDSNTSSSASA